MKTVCFTSMMTVCILICLIGIPAQNIQSQVKQHRQFNSEWKPEMEQFLNDNEFPNANLRLQDIENIHFIKNPETTRANQFKPASDGALKLDSVLYNYWGGGVYMKYIYSYDAGGNLISENCCVLDQTISQWYIYLRWEYTYDANGNNNFKYCDSWDYSTSQLVHNWREEHACDANGKDTVFTTYGWDNSTSDWTAKWYKYEYAYDTIGNITLVYYYDAGESNLWYLYDKLEYAYDTIGNLTLISHYLWNESTSQWLESEKEEYMYDANGNDTSYITCVFNQFTSQWTNSYKVSSEYDANGNMTLWTDYLWDQGRRIWVINSKREYSYDVNGNNIELIDYIWDDWEGGFLKGAKQEFTYDTYGNNLITYYYHWSGMWVGDKIFSYYYSEINPSFIPQIPDKNISVYPNPATDFIIFKTNHSLKPSTIEIFDLHGKKVISKEFSGSGQISVSQFKSGMYFYIVVSDGEIFKGKISIRQH
jgi:hypothetical protein